MAVVSALALTVGAGAATRPALKLVDSDPVKLRGLAFKPAERVRVTVRLEGEHYARTVRTSSSGTFVVAFSGTAADPCSGLEAFAAGSLGSRASFKLPQRLCPMPLGPQQP